MKKLLQLACIGLIWFGLSSEVLAMEYTTLSSPLGHEIIQWNDTTGELTRWCETSGTYCRSINGSYSAIDAQGNQMCALRDDAHIICWKKTLGGFREKDLGTSPSGADFRTLTVGRDFVAVVDSNNEVFYRFFRDSTWNQYMPGSTFEQKIDAGSDWFCVYAGGVFPWETDCFKPSTNETDEVSSYWGLPATLDDMDRAYTVLPDGYSPNLVTLRQKELGTTHTNDFILQSLPSNLKAGGESVCANGGASAECFGQLEGIWNATFHAENFMVTGFGGVDALIFIESGVPNIVTL